MPKISVLLTSYNHADYLRESIDSILAQSFKDFELLIVDDGSVDNSQEIIRNVKDKRVIPILREKNVGEAIVPEIISQFKGEYFAIAHSDDRWEKDKLEKQLAYMESHKETAACFTWVQYIDEFGNPLNNTDAQKYTDFNVENKSRFEWLNYFAANGNCLCHPSVLMRTEIQKELDLFTYALGSLPDFYRWVKLSTKYDVYVYPEQLTCFRIRANGLNTSGKNISNIIRNYFELLQVPALYENLNSEEFIKVFPEAEQYYYPDLKYCRDYLTAFTFVNKQLIYSFNLYGLQKLYDLFQDAESRRELEDCIGFTRKDFVALSGKNDVLNTRKLLNITEMTLFYKNDGDYSAESSFRKSIILDGDNRFTVLFNNLNISADEFRFDPVENQFIKLDELTITADGATCMEVRTNGQADDPLCFLTDDPQIFFTLEGTVTNIQIHGRISFLDSRATAEQIRKITAGYNEIINEKQKEIEENQSVKKLIMKRMGFRKGGIHERYICHPGYTS